MKEIEKAEKISLEIIQEENTKYLQFRIEGKEQILAVDQTIGQVLKFLEVCKKTLNEFKKDIKNFKINDYLTLKLEDNQTIIYVKGVKFHQCKYLLINIPTDQVEEYDAIDSIDEAKEKYDDILHGNNNYSSKTFKYELSPEEEFRGHCSNLQAWYENEYDTRLLHSNLAFPLLAKLNKVDDPLAKKVFKEEISRRLGSGNINVFKILKIHLKEFTNEELRIVLDNIENSEIKLEIIKYLILQKESPNLISRLKSIIYAKLIYLEEFEAIELLRQYRYLYSGEELLELSKEIKHPILKILVQSFVKTSEYSNMYSNFQEGNGGFFLFDNNIFICAYDKDISLDSYPYHEEKSIHEDIKCKYLGGKKFLYFGIDSKSHNCKIVFKLEHIVFARKFLHENEDIKIALPKDSGPLRISSKHERLKIYINPEYFY